VRLSCLNHLIPLICERVNKYYIMFIMSMIILKMARHSITLAMAGRSPCLLEEQYKINIIPYYTVSANYYLSS